jgi:uncharacterized membrane protein
MRSLIIERTLGWIAVALSVLILLVSASIRLTETRRQPPPNDAFAIRYVQHQRIALLHIIPGLVFLTLGPLQFIRRIRQRRIELQLGLGRVLATVAAISGLSALILNFRLPAFGGIGTQSATVLFGTIFLFSLGKAIRHIRRKEVSLHREWMIRTFALALGVASIRVFLGVLMALSHYSFEQVFGTSFWLGFSVNLVVAEVWINYTRDRSPLAERGAAQHRLQTHVNDR